MMGTITLGVLLVIAGAVLGGTFALPGKFSGNSPWELLWGSFFLIATIIIPVSIILLMGDSLFNIYGQFSFWELLPPLFFGFLWGLGSFISGLAFATAGLSLAYAITMGMQTGFGSSVPLIFGGGENLSVLTTSIVIAGIVICILGVVLMGYAGILKEKKINLTGSVNKKLIRKGILFAIFGGIFAACLNYSFSFGQHIVEAAKVEFNGNASAATISVWILAFLGGSISSVGYCVYLFVKNKEYKNLKRYPLGKVFFLAFLMAIFHNGAIFLYGRGSDMLGSLGTTVGFAIFASGMMLVGNLNGFFTKEWNGIEIRIKKWMYFGLTSIVLGILLLAYSNSII